MGNDPSQAREVRLSRRLFLRLAALIGAFGATWRQLIEPGPASAQAQGAGWPLADEPVETTLNRLFGSRKVNSGDGKIKLTLPAIAEDGGNVAISVDADFPVTGEPRASHIYIISDKNRRPMLAKISLTSDSGSASIATSVRLATSTEVRAIVEMNDGTLYAVSKTVRVTISGCDLPPSG
jgi:sulfur-oxidizing protein SoxY